MMVYTMEEKANSTLWTLGYLVIVPHESMKFSRSPN